MPCLACGLPSTSEQIARVAKLNERYVREWLGAMVTVGMVEYDPATRKYHLTQEHAVCLTRARQESTTSLCWPGIYWKCGRQGKVVECSRKGGGVPYSEYSQFQQLQAEETTRVFDARLIDQIIQLVEGLIGQPKKGTSVLDVGCSQGHAINLLAKAFPKSKFPGFDIF
jgi:hypothetical protein